MLRHLSRMLGYRNFSQHFQTLLLNTDIIDACEKHLVFRDTDCLEHILTARELLEPCTGCFFGENIPFC